VEAPGTALTCYGLLGILRWRTEWYGARRELLVSTLIRSTGRARAPSTTSNTPPTVSRPRHNHHLPLATRKCCRVGSSARCDGEANSELFSIICVVAGWIARAVNDSESQISPLARLADMT
jgi:hypothetical protein